MHGRKIYSNHDSYKYHMSCHICNYMTYWLQNSSPSFHKYSSLSRFSIIWKTIIVHYVTLRYTMLCQYVLCQIIQQTRSACDTYRQVSISMQLSKLCSHVNIWANVLLTSYPAATDVWRLQRHYKSYNDITISFCP